MKSKKLSKRERLIVYEKYDGHCAYCGCSLEYKDMQVDHIKPFFHNWPNSDKERWAKELAGDDTIDNLNPSCRACNFRKGTLSLDGFREALEHQLTCLERDFTYRMAKRYGLVEEHPHEIKFYFEKFKQE